MENMRMDMMDDVFAIIVLSFIFDVLIMHKGARICNIISMRLMQILWKKQEEIIISPCFINN